MKYFFLALFLISSAAGMAQTPVLTELAKRLGSLPAISYQSTTEISNKAENYHSKFGGSSYIEFNTADQQSIARFQFRDHDSRQIYNGSDYFTLDDADKSSELTVKAKPEMFASLMFFYNTIPALRSMLSHIIQTDSISKHQGDTTMLGKVYKTVRIGMHRSSMVYLGQSRPFTAEITVYYTLVIDPVTYMPYQIIQTNSVDKGYFTRTIFTQVNTNPKKPVAASWLHRTYEAVYHPKKEVKEIPLISAGSQVPAWTLPDVARPASVKQSDLTGKIVLMDFWIKNCGPCMSSFPHLQALQKKYGGAKFQLISVNAEDPKKDVAFFYRREKPAYKMLYNGKALAATLGVPAFPTIILTDATGKVIYADSGFDQEKVEKLIVAALSPPAP